MAGVSRDFGSFADAYQPIGATVEIARGEDWSLAAWETAEGFCLARAQPDGGLSRARGRVPVDPSSYVIVVSGTPAMSSDRSGLLAGLVLTAVSRVEVELHDGTLLCTETLPAPAALGADLRTFVMLTPSSGQPGPSYPPAAVELVASNGRVLQRLTTRPR
jgi:hypothetical protein